MINDEHMRHTFADLEISHLKILGFTKQTGLRKSSDLALFPVVAYYSR